MGVLLNAAVPVKEDVIIEMEDILGDAVAAKDAAETAAISGARRFDTKQDMLDDSSSLYVGSVIIIKDRGYAQYVSMPVGAALLDGDIALNTGVIAQLQIKPVNDLRWWGDLNAVNLQAALDRTQTSSSLVAAGGETISCEGLDVPIEQGINFNAGNNIKGGNFRAVSSFWDNNVVDVLNGVVGIPMFSIANVRGCKFTDFVIDGGITTNTSGAPAILVDDSNNTTVENFNILHHDHYGVWFKTKAGQSSIRAGVIGQWVFGDIGANDPIYQTAFNCAIDTADVMVSDMTSFGGLWQFSFNNVFHLQVNNIHPWCAGANKNGVLITQNTSAVILNGVYSDGVDIYNYSKNVKIVQDLGTIGQFNSARVRLFAPEADFTGSGIKVETMSGDFNNAPAEKIVFEDGDFNWAYRKECIIQSMGITDTARPYVGRAIKAGIETHNVGATQELFLTNAKAEYNVISDRIRSGFNVIGINSSGSGFRTGYSTTTDGTGTPTWGTRIGEFWSTAANGINFGDANDQYIGGGGLRVRTISDWGTGTFGAEVQLWATPVNNTVPMVAFTANTSEFKAGVDATQNLGSASRRFDDGFFVNTPVGSSDERLKLLDDITDVEKAVASKIKIAIKKFRWNDAIDKKGNGARIHFGVGAQTVVAIFSEYGLNPNDYALLCYDEWDNEYIEHAAELDDEGYIIKEAYTEHSVVAGNRYGIRYSELAMFIISAM